VNQLNLFFNVRRCIFGNYWISLYDISYIHLFI